MKTITQVEIYHEAFKGYGPDGDPETDKPAYSYLLCDLPESYRWLEEHEPHNGCFRVNNAVDGTGGWEGGWEYPMVFKTRSLSVGDVVLVKIYKSEDLLGFDPGEGEHLFDGYPLQSVAWRCCTIGWETIDHNVRVVVDF